jgi:LmbE family N-acetylglucosaminyl deacetylase
VLDVLRGPVLVISPHLDDAALSLGATIYTLARRQEVCILTVFANDPESELPAQHWDEYCGFPTAAAAARGRRAEDTAASRILGAQIRWLPFADSSHSSAPDLSKIKQAVAAAVRNAETVLVPGFPLTHPDHAIVSSLTAETCVETNCRLGFYVEQPYASRALLSSGRIEQKAGERFHEAQRLLCFAAGGWRRSSSVYPPPVGQPNGTREGGWVRPTGAGAAAWIAKHRAISAYRSQVNFRFHARVVLGEIGTGGEYVWWVSG